MNSNIAVHFSPFFPTDDIISHFNERYGITSTKKENARLASFLDDLDEMEMLDTIDEFMWVLVYCHSDGIIYAFPNIIYSQFDIMWCDTNVIVVVTVPELTSHKKNLT